MIITHNSKKEREYTSAIDCDQWGRCEGENHEVFISAMNASKCTSYSCNYVEILELKLRDDFLKKSIDITKFQELGYLNARNLTSN